MKKKSIYCGRCEAVCEWYKKGKGKRILHCPNCGVIAHNPIPFLAAYAAKKVGGYALKKLTEPKAQAPEAQRVITKERGPSAAERAIEHELYGGR